MCSTLKALSAMRTLMQVWTQMKRSGQFHPIPFSPFWQLLICKIHILQAITYFLKILNDRYLTARAYLTPKALLPSKEFTATQSKAGNHMKRNLVKAWEVRVLKKLKETTVYLVCWLLLSAQLLAWYTLHLNKWGVWFCFSTLAVWEVFLIFWNLQEK